MFSPIFDQKSFVILLLLTVAALAGNYFIFDLFFGISFLFGSIASFIVLSTFGNTWGILVALISNLPTIFLWHHPYALIVFVLEVCFVAFLRRQQQNILLLDILYWLFVGIPLGWVLYTFFLHLESTQVLLLILKQAVNGIANALIATLIITYLPLNRWIGLPQNDRKISLQANILNLLISCLFLPLLVLLLLNSNRVINHLTSDIESDLEIASSLVATELQNWYQTHLERLNNLAEIAVESNIEPSEKLQVSTELMQQLLPGFYGISVENAVNNRVAFAGSLLNGSTAKTDDNLLIKSAKSTRKPVIKNVNNNSLPTHYIKLVVPIFISKQFVGSINSTLDLHYLIKLLKITIGNRPWQVAVLDAQNHIIASTKVGQLGISFARRNEKEFRYLNSTMYNWSPSKQNLPPISRWQQSLYGKKTLINDIVPWNIVVELPAKSYSSYLDSLYINNFSIILLIGFLAIESAVLVSRNLSKPLAKLAEETNNLPNKLNNKEDIEWFSSRVFEINFLINNFRSMATALSSKFNEIQVVNESLEEQVQESTNDALLVKQRLVTAINQYQQTEEALHETEARYWDLFENANDLIQSVTPEGKFIYVNRAWREALGYSNTEVDSLSILDIIECDSQAHCMEIFERVMLGEKINKVETIFITKFGKRLIVEGSVNCKLVSGKPISTRSIFRDITERKQAEAEIQNALVKEKELGELKSRFISTASHEFRTPLSIILMSARLLEQFSQQASESQKNLYFERIKNATQRMNNLLDDVLLVGKSESGKAVINGDYINLTKFCQDLVEEIQMSVGSERTINFASQGNDNAYLDEKLLHHILSNLLSNAIKYSPQGGEVSFKLIGEPNQATFEINDCGIGIPPNDIEQLFSFFHRGSNVKSIPGTGLGLSIVKQYVDLHGGTITVNSEVGIGTTFIVVLPFLPNN